MSKRLIPLASMEQILKQQGAERVSDKAKSEFKKVLEDKAEEIAKDSIKYALHAGRKTVKSSDIKLAAKERT
jgi:DNA-binding protein